MLLNFLHFSSFLTKKMAAILNFEKFFNCFFQSAKLDPQRGAQSKFQLSSSNMVDHSDFCPHFSAMQRSYFLII